MKLVRVLMLEPHRRYELSDLMDHWREAPPILPEPRPATRSGGAGHAGHGESPNPETCLEEMRYKGRPSIHQSQLACTASLVRHGLSLEMAVETVLEATRKAVANDPRCAEWN